MRLRQRRLRLRLGPGKYAEVQKQVLDRDGWRCQDCGAMKELQFITSGPEADLAGM
jgi:hypothetical protein